MSLFDEIIRLRPEWAGTKLTKNGKETGWHPEDGSPRIIMTGTASDRPGLQDHVFNKGQKRRMATRFKDPKDPLKLVIVREGEGGEGAGPPGPPTFPPEGAVRKERG